MTIDNCKNILCIRPDNMGDLLMSSPAIASIKQTFGCKITVLTSSMAKGIAPFISCIDEVIVFDLPWVKKDNETSYPADFEKIIANIKERAFDAAVIFTVYSQNPLPSVMIAYLAGIPIRISYCRENPYNLLTHWLPDKEPYTFIQHQVKRDIALTTFVGANCTNQKLQLFLPDEQWKNVSLKLARLGVDITKRIIICHAGVSEKKRECPKELWIATAKKIAAEIDCQIVFTGSKSEKILTEYLATETSGNAISLGGLLYIAEFLQLIKNAALVVSVNTVTIHIAAATETPVIALYAFTNPQHFPWKAKGKVLTYSVPPELRSKNEIIKYVTDNIYPNPPDTVSTSDIVKTAYEIVVGCKLIDIPEMPGFKKI